MRTFEERKAEIFSRSEKRIAERKRNRRRVLAIVIPLCICVAVSGALFKSYDKSEGSEYKDSYDGNFDVADATYFSYVNIEADNGVIKNYAEDIDGDRLVEISNTLNFFFPEEYSVKSGSALAESVTEYQKTEDAAQSGSVKGSGKTETMYEIEVINAVGESFLYSLSGNKLTNEQTGEEKMLTSGELEEFLADLGIKEVE